MGRTTSLFLRYSFAAAFLYGVFLYFRGFGWDGDSLISAAQYVKLINPSLYGIDDGGTQPKLLAILTFGVAYQLGHSFVWLTLVAILLNAAMVGALCAWVDAVGGIPFISFLGLAVNIHWYENVVNCDNPAFSVPLAIFGLLLYGHKRKEMLGILLLLLASLFRPGAELIILFLLVLKLFQEKRVTPLAVVAAIAFVVGALHSTYGYLLAYPTKAAYLRECIVFFPEAAAQVARYLQSPLVLLQYVRVVGDQALARRQAVMLFPAMLGLFYVLRRNLSIKFVGAVAIATLIQPAGAFIYGVIINMNSDKVLEFTLIYPVLAAFALQGSAEVLAFVKRRQRVLATLVCLALLADVGSSGVRRRGQYEANFDGPSELGWKRVTEQEVAAASTVSPLPKRFSAAISKDDRIPFLLDFGTRAGRVRYLEDMSERELADGRFDLILRNRGQRRP